MIQLNFRDSKPIYEQVEDGIRKLVVNNLIAADEKLPSVRELASKYALNPNTISRAYRELEEQGYIYTLNGKGTFVAANEKVNDMRKEELLQQFDELVKELSFLMVPTEQLVERVSNVKMVMERGTEE
ncbi:MAG: GntR family transcriptional regulator [Lachnobacterium sp.]|nr:GntR family transcriptional regulator [Lachnobacterium sp.]MDD6633349.1 GntR family transcriptional regulator [Lachnobacterium sp.]MDY2912370.1 GntR family transcriptional regulator [Agathobacter sp.]